MAQKSNSHYVPQPYTNQSVFKSLLNSTSETEKLSSPRRVCVLFVAHVNTSTDRSDRQPTSVKSWLWALLDVLDNLGSVSPTVVNFNRRFSPHFNLQLAYIRFTNAS